MNYEAELQKQLGFLKSSLKGYSAGSYDEAVRMATTLRVIFHHTAQSRSLIDYLDGWDRTIVTTILDKTGCVMEGLLLSVPIHYMPDGRPKHFNELSIREWWEQPIVLKQGIMPTRGQIIKWTANKDGGTHYDEEQPAAYLHVKKMLKFKRIDDDSERDTLAQRFIGHFAYEVLHSFGGPDFLKEFEVDRN